MRSPRTWEVLGSCWELPGCCWHWLLERPLCKNPMHFCAQLQLGRPGQCAQQKVRTRAYYTAKPHRASREYTHFGLQRGCWEQWPGLGNTPLPSWAPGYIADSAGVESWRENWGWGGRVANTRESHTLQEHIIGETAWNWAVGQKKKHTAGACTSEPYQNPEKKIPPSVSLHAL